jgi:hypothetical protein
VPPDIKRTGKFPVEFEDAIRQLQAIHAWHLHIGQDERNCLPVLLEENQTRISIAGEYHGVAGAFQKGFHDSPDEIAIVHHQDRPGGFVALFHWASFRVCD